MRYAAGLAMAPVLGGCASSPEAAQEGDPPTLRGAHALRVTVRAGILQEEVRGVLDFQDAEWLTYESVGEGRQQYGPCRYQARGRRLEARCGIDVRIEETREGFLARVRSGLRQSYETGECISWSTDGNGNRTCVATRPAERFRIVEGRGEALLEKLGGGGRTDAP